MENFIDQCTWVYPIRKTLAQNLVGLGRKGIRIARDIFTEQGRDDLLEELEELDTRLEGLAEMMDETHDRVLYLDNDDMNLVTKRCVAFARLIT